MKKARKLIIFAILLSVLAFGTFSPSAKADFFDDVVDKLDPTQRHSLWDPFCVFCGDYPMATPAPVVVNANSQTPNPTVSIYANPININYNESSTVYWNSNNAVFCNASGGTNGWSGGRNIFGTFYTGNLTNTTTYNITCTNNVGAYAVGAITIFVNNNQNNQNQYSPTVQLTADDISIDYYDGTTIRWYSNNAVYCNATDGTNGWRGNRNTSGTFYTGALYNTTTYGITCSNNNGSISDYITIRVDDNNDSNNNRRPTVNLRADDTSIGYNQSTIIRWDSNYADYCRTSDGTNGWSGTRSTSGTFYTGRLTRDVTYRIKCTNDDGSDSDSVTIRVDDRDGYYNYYDYSNLNNINNDANFYNSSLVATTMDATQISNTSAQLNSTITNLDNDFVNSWFEWGTTANLGMKTTSMPVGRSPSVIHKDTLNGLSPGTIYYFRAVAENSAWRNNGPVLSFTTSGTKQSAITYIYTTTNTNTPTNTETKTDTATTDQTQSLLGANVFGSGSFFPVSILGWLILIILILILFLLIKYLQRDLSNNRSEHTQKHA